MIETQTTSDLRSRNAIRALLEAHWQIGEKIRVTRVPRIGLRSSFSLSLTANDAADPTRTARTRNVGTYRATARRLYAAASVRPRVVCYYFTL